jgi:hypothetical protein
MKNAMIINHGGTIWNLWMCGNCDCPGPDDPNLFFPQFVYEKQAVQFGWTFMVKPDGSGIRYALCPRCAQGKEKPR